MAVVQQAQLEDLAEQCGLVCASEGIVEGNASISGVASVDAFFASVVKFQGKAEAVASGIDAQLEGIRGDFGIEGDLVAGLQAEINANVQGSLTIEAEPARCQVDAHATLEAQAKCDASIDPGSAMVACEGSCEVEASADIDCGAEADLKCTVSAPAVECMGECKGSCEVDASAGISCEGKCTGGCDGTCSLMNAQGECQGSCDGMCTGSCETELAAEAECSGTCKGECTVTNPSGGCEGGVRASCEAQGSAMVMCNGRCEGNFEPPSASAECEASAKADASLNVECSPPRVAIHYELQAGLDAEASARFEAAVKNLEVRLPALIASIKKGGIVVDAGGELVADAGVAVSGAVEGLQADADIKASIGLGCALLELPKVGDAIGSASTKLEGSVSAAIDLTGALGV